MVKLWKLISECFIRSSEQLILVKSNHQTINLVFPEIFSVWEVEKENILFLGSKFRKPFLDLDQQKVRFLFQLLKLRKIGENKIGGLMSGTRDKFSIFVTFTTQ